MAITEINYEFRFPDGKTKSHTFKIDSATHTLVHKPDAKLPDWTKLDFKKCSHCPLDSKKVTYCPVAVNIFRLVEDFKDLVSYSSVFVTVKTAQRVYAKQATLQDGIFSALGLTMPCGACPHLAFLKPMTHFHLPFATTEETIVRAVSFYLTKQFFVTRKGGKGDFSLKNLKSLYENVQTVNAGILQRIQSVAVGDADSNALNTLASFASLLAVAISKDFTRIEPIFTEAS